MGIGCENNLHNGQKKRLCDGFLKVSMDLSQQAKSIEVLKDKISNTNDVKYSQRQITIAYLFLKEQITKENAGKILESFSNTMSMEKFLSKRISKASDLTKISDNKTKDTKHLKDLEAAKRLITGKKNKTAVKDIDTVITAFLNNYQSRYQ